jgi:hypothetical protein
MNEQLVKVHAFPIPGALPFAGNPSMPRYPAEPHRWCHGPASAIGVASETRRDNLGSFQGLDSGVEPCLPCFPNNFIPNSCTAVSSVIHFKSHLNYKRSYLE